MFETLLDAFKKKPTITPYTKQAADLYKKRLAEMKQLRDAFLTENTYYHSCPGFDRLLNIANSELEHSNLTNVFFLEGHLDSYLTHLPPKDKDLEKLGWLLEADLFDNIRLGDVSILYFEKSRAALGLLSPVTIQDIPVPTEEWQQNDYKVFLEKIKEIRRKMPTRFTPKSDFYFLKDLKTLGAIGYLINEFDKALESKEFDPPFKERLLYDRAQNIYRDAQRLLQSPVSSATSTPTTTTSVTSLPATTLPSVSAAAPSTTPAAVLPAPTTITLNPVPSPPASVTTTVTSTTPATSLSTVPPSSTSTLTAVPSPSFFNPASVANPTPPPKISLELSENLTQTLTSKGIDVQEIKALRKTDFNSVFKKSISNTATAAPSDDVAYCSIKLNNSNDPVYIEHHAPPPSSSTSATTLPPDHYYCSITAEGLKDAITIIAASGATSVQLDDDLSSQLEKPISLSKPTTPTSSITIKKVLEGLAAEHNVNIMNSKQENICEPPASNSALKLL